MTFRALLGLTTVLAATSQLAIAQRSQQLYFPAAKEWETVTPRAVGWNEARLEKALDYARDAKSSGVVILHNGRIMAERYWQPENPSFRYKGLLHGKSSPGHAIEDVASCQKSVVSTMVGIAADKKLLTLDDPVHKHLGKGWSKATEAQESRITIRHLLTMTSGLNERLRFEAAPGTKWKYNTAAYSQCLQIVCEATGKEANEITREWITRPLGMSDSKWVKRRGLGANKFGFATTARDLARFGLMIQARGKWDDGQKTSQIVPESYLKQALNPSQKLNRAYGYLWWLNKPRRARARVISAAPKDLFGAFGALGRKCYVVPSLGLVVTRLGDEPPNKREFQNEFWRLLMAAAPK